MATQQMNFSALSGPSAERLRQHTVQKLSPEFYAPGFMDKALSDMFQDLQNESIRIDPNTRSIYYKTDIDRLTVNYEKVISGMLTTELHPVNSIMFPLTFTDSLEWNITQMKFVASLPTLNPEEGVNRTIGKMMEESTYKLRRYGTHFRATSDFMNQPEGRADVALNLLYIAGQMVLNAAFLAMQALASVTPEEQENYMVRLQNREFYEQMKLDSCENMFLAYKDQNGWPLSLQIAAVELMRTNNGTRPTDAVIPMDKRVMLMRNVNYTQYDIVGPDGQDRLFGNGAFLEKIAGIRIWDAPNFPGGESLSQLNHVRRLAQHYIFQKEHDMQDIRPNSYESGFRVDDYSIDSKRYISFRELADSCPALQTTTLKSGRRGYKLNFNWIRNNAAVPGDTRTWMFMDDGEHIPGYGPTDEWTEQDLWDAFGMIGLMPCCGVIGQDIYVAISGEAMGRTVMTRPNIEMGADAGNQTRLINHTAYSGVVFTDRGRKYIVNNMFLNGMLPGWSTKPMTLAEIEKYKNNGFMLENRLETNGMYLILFPRHLDKFPMNIPGSLEVLGRSTNDTLDQKQFPFCDEWAHAYGFSRARNTSFFDPQHGTISTVSFQAGMTYTGIDGKQIQVVSKTPFGPTATCPGMARALRKGENVFPGLQATNQVRD